ncbi:MAG: thiol reductant ABC exporter subunit CydC [Bellilinea sp.]
MKVAFRLLTFLKPFNRWVLLSIFFSTATIASGIGLLGTSAYLISRAALHPSIAVLQVAIVGVRFFGISRGIFRYLERLTSHSVNFRLLAQLRVWVYRVIEPLIPAATPEVHSGDLLNRVISDVDSLENFYVRVVSPYVAAGITVIGMGFFVGQIHPALGLVLVAGMLVCGLLVPLAALWLGQKPGQAIVAVQSRWSARFIESVQGIGDLTAFGQTASAARKLESLNGELRKAQIRQVGGGAWVNASNNLITNLTMAAVLWLAIPLVSNGYLEGFLLPVVTMLVLASFEAVTPLAQAAHVHSVTRQAGKRLFELENIAPAVTDPQKPLSFRGGMHKIEIRDLSFQYLANEPSALQGINLNLPAGKKIAVVGPSGAGKSTIINLMMRLWEFDHGEILLDDRDIRLFNAEEVRNQFTVIPQFAYIFNASLRQNLRLARPNAEDEELIDGLQQAGLGEWFRTLPDGLNTWVGEHGLRLSGGERQRLGVARVLLRDTPFIILDEPTANLDAITEAGLIDRLHAAFSGKGVLWITHRRVGLERMDEIIVLDDGKIIERGTHDALIRTGGHYARLWELQNRMLPLTSSSLPSS